MRKSTLLLVCLVAGCGGNGASNGGGGGADMTAGGGHDAGVTRDLAMPPDLAPPPDYGKKLVDGDYSLAGVTDDGYAIVNDGKKWWAIETATAKPTEIGPAGDSDAAQVGHKMVFIFSNVDQNTGVGALSVWSSVGGLHAIAQSSFYYVIAEAPDGSAFAYTDNVNAAGDTGDLYSDNPNHSASKKLVTGIDLANCFPSVAVAGGKVVASHCPAGMMTAEVTSYDVATGMGTPLLMGATSFLAIDKARTRVIAKTTSNAASVITLSNAMATPLAMSFGDGLFTPDGNSVVYATTGGALDVVPAAGGNPTVLQMSKVARVREVSPDGKFALYYANQDQNTGLTDYFLSSTAMAAAPVTINSDQSSDLYGPGFTDDSTYALVETNVDPQLQVGPLQAQPTAGGASKMLGDGVWIWLSAGAGRVLFTDNFNSTQSDATADLELVDLAGAGTSMKLAPNIRPDFAVSMDKRKVYFTVAGDGLYEKTLP